MSRQGNIRGRRKIRRFKKRRRSFRWGWAIRLGKTALSLAMLGSLSFLGLNVYQYLLNSGSLNVGEIKVMGCLHTTESELLHLTRLDFQAGLFNLDLNKVSSQLSQHPWIEKAKVKRNWSRKAVIIEVQERIPLALILLDDLYLLDRHGMAFKKAEFKDRLDFPILTGLPPREVMEGEKTAAELIRQALEFLDLLKQGKFLTPREISEVHLSQQSGLTLVTLNGMPIRVGRGGFTEKLARLEKVLPDLQQKSKEVEYLDLNYPKKVVVKMKTPEKEKFRNV